MKYRISPYVLNVSFILLTAALVLTAGTASAKDYIRSCQAVIVVDAKTPRGQQLRDPQFPAFTGKGKVGWYAPNKARKRARKNIIECTNAAWENRYSTRKHSLCSENNRIYNFPFNMGLHPAITYAVCNANSGHESIMVDVRIGFRGKKGCLGASGTIGGDALLLTNNYYIECPRDYELH